jgi:hypothetical protein
MRLKYGGVKMKKLLLVSIFFALAVVFPMPATAWVDINAGISLPPPIIFEGPAEIIVMPPTSGVYVVADADAGKTKGGPIGRDEKSQEQSLEKMKATESEEKSDWKINVWPVEPPDNVKSLPQMKDENKHTPPDRF